MSKFLIKKSLVISIILIFVGASVLPISGFTYKNITEEKINTLINQPIDSEELTVTNWPEFIKVTASDGEAWDSFGYRVSINGDYAIVGAYTNDNSIGSAYIYKLNNTIWEEEALLFSSDGSPSDLFGWSVSLCGDYAIIGAPNDDDNGENSGSAYIFKKIGNSWIQEQKILSPDGEENDHFGFSVSIDMNTCIIGAYYDDDIEEDSGSAYIFKNTGTVWELEAKLLALDASESKRFGFSVSIDGDYAIIGADGDFVNGEWSGAAYIFKRTGTSWEQEAKLFASDGLPYDWFGKTVSIDGEYSIIAADGCDDKGVNSGAAYIFKRTDTSWFEEKKILAPDGSDYNYFGNSVSIDDGFVIIGAYYDDDKGEQSGSTYIFKLLDTWRLWVKFVPYDVTTGDIFGASVSISGEYAVIGSPYDDDKGEQSGSTYFVNLIDNIDPICSCEKPEEGFLYILNQKIFYIGNTIVIGPFGGITVEVKANDFETGIYHVDIIIDGETQTGIWNQASQSYVYDYDITSLIPRQVSLKTIAWDKAENDKTCCEFSFLYWNLKLPP